MPAYTTDQYESLQGDERQRQLQKEKQTLAALQGPFGQQNYSPGELQAAIAETQRRITQLDEPFRMERERTSVIAALKNVAEGGGKAYGATMRETNTGNSRIRALASSGRGGLNANLNAQNAIGISTAAGTQQAVANREAEKTQARAALGQAIAQGQDYNAAEGQSVLDALAQTPDAKNPAENLRPVGQVGEAIWTATQGSGDTSQAGRNAKNQGQHKRWG